METGLNFDEAAPAQGSGQFKPQSSGVIRVKLEDIVLTRKPNSTQQVLFVFKNMDEGNEFTSNYITLLNSDGKTVNNIGLTEINRILSIIGFKSFNDIKFKKNEEKSTDDKATGNATNIPDKTFKIAYAVTLGESYYNGKAKNKKVILDTFSDESDKSAYEIKNDKPAKSIEAYKDLKDEYGPYFEKQNKKSNNTNREDDIDAALGDFEVDLGEDEAPF